MFAHINPYSHVYMMIFLFFFLCFNKRKQEIKYHYCLLDNLHSLGLLPICEDYIFLSNSDFSLTISNYSLNLFLPLCNLKRLTKSRGFSFSTTTIYAIVLKKKKISSYTSLPFSVDINKLLYLRQCCHKNLLAGKHLWTLRLVLCVLHIFI